MRQYENDLLVDQNNTLPVGTPHCYFVNKIELISSHESNKEKKSIMKTLNNFIKKILDKDIQSLLKAEYLDGDLELTEKGKSQLMSILSIANKDELVELANEEIAKIEKLNK